MCHPSVYQVVIIVIIAVDPAAGTYWDAAGYKLGITLRQSGMDWDEPGGGRGGVAG